MIYNNDTTFRIPSENAIAVIATFSSNGEIKPLRIRLKVLNRQIEANIETIIKTMKTTTGFTFDCFITVRNIQKHILLHYCTSSNQWKVEECL